jgi:NADH-quinone oxidoreductase subunit I
MIGTGIAKGLVLTAKNLLSTYTDKERLPTIEYPDEKQALPEAARQFPMLIFDGEDSMKGLRCTACQICEKECPPKCIYIVRSKDKRVDYKGQNQFYPAVFDIDYSVCMSCQICVEVCPFESIKMNTEFELATPDRFGGLLIRKQQLAKSNAHYQKIHPTEAAASDAAMAIETAKAKAAAEAKTKAAAAAAAAKTAATPTASPEASPEMPKPAVATPKMPM